MTQAASAFDDLAPGYDDTFTHSLIGTAMRAAVWERLDLAVAPGSRVLELNCGTGEDALHLGAAGADVLATDVSPAMVDETMAKAARSGVAVRSRVLAIEELASIGADGPFDVVFSNFGGLNCVASIDAVAVAAHSVLRPGGRLIACVMGPVVPWEVAWFLGRARPRDASRRWRRSTEWRGVTIRYPSLRSFERSFERNGFRREHVRAIGAFVPPSYAEDWARRHPGTFRRLVQAERRIADRRPAANLADHYLVEMVRR